MTDDIGSIIDAVTVRAFDQLRGMEEKLGPLGLSDAGRDLFTMGIHLGVTSFIKMYIAE